MRTKWKSGEIIREVETGRPFLVLHAFRDVGTIIADLQETQPLAIVLLEHSYDKFEKDTNMRQTITGDWQKEHPVKFLEI